MYLATCLKCIFRKVVITASCHNCVI